MGLARPPGEGGAGASTSWRSSREPAFTGQKLFSRRLVHEALARATTDPTHERDRRDGERQPVCETLEELVCARGGFARLPSLTAFCPSSEAQFDRKRRRSMSAAGGVHAGSPEALPAAASFRGPALARSKGRFLAFSGPIPSCSIPRGFSDEIGARCRRPRPSPS